jgi:hypothetical protein
MARDGSGVYTAPSNSFNPAVEGTAIDEADWNTTLDDVEAAFTESVFTAGMGATDNRLVRTDGTSTKKVQGTGITVSDTDAVSGVTSLILTGVVVASLPAGSAGMLAFATNGRKNGEGAAAGTGVLVFHDGTNWCACDTGATVAA